MSDDEEWELTPHHRIEELKREIEKLKKNPFEGTGSGENILQSIERLDHSIHELIQIFKMAQEDMGSKDMQEDPKFEKLSEKIDKLTMENRKIAQGIVSLASIVKKDTAPPQHSAPKPLTNPNEMNPPPFIQPRSSVPPPSPPPQTPEKQDRKSIFDKFKG